MGFLGRPSASVKGLRRVGKGAVGIGLEFSKPARFVKKHTHKEKARFVHSHAARSVSVATTGICVSAPPPTAPIEDSHLLVQSALARLFAVDAQLRVVSPVENGLDSVDRTLQLTADSVLLDVWVPAVADAGSENPANQKSPMFKVVVVATEFAHEMARAAEEAEGVVSRIFALRASEAPLAAKRRLPVSNRELSVLIQVAAGQSNKQIGKLLGISTQTVRNHLSRIFHKLGASNRTEAVMRAMRLGLLIV